MYERLRMVLYGCFDSIRATYDPSSSGFFIWLYGSGWMGSFMAGLEKIMTNLRAEFEGWRKVAFPFDDLEAFEIEFAFKAYQAGHAAAVPDGWRAVPVDLTDKQVCMMAFKIMGANENGECRTDDPRWPDSVLRTVLAHEEMLAAAPTPTPCPNAKCDDKSQCWESCGELGKSEKHAAPVPTNQCWCETCDIKANVLRTRMSLCPDCGNKRCPKATNHANACTNSNESGQIASAAPTPTKD